MKNLPEVSTFKQADEFDGIQGVLNVLKI